MTGIHGNSDRPLRRELGLFATSAGAVLALVLSIGCSYDNGTTTSKSTKTVETPNETRTTTTTRERTVEDAPR